MLWLLLLLLLLQAVMPWVQPRDPATVIWVNTPIPLLLALPYYFASAAAAVTAASCCSTGVATQTCIP
jgi:hypothetical protein